VESFLGIDIGNTNIKIGLWQHEHWHTIQRLPTDPASAFVIEQFLGDAPDTIQSAAIASVVPALTGVFVELTRRNLHIEPLVISARLNTGVRIDVDAPEKVGADRIANVAAAYALYGGPAIVADFGTATKFEVISRRGIYSGGSIAPGIGISLDALISHTALLDRVTIQPPPNAIPRNTAHSIQDGLFWGYVGLTEGMISRLRDSMDEGSSAMVIATGGFADLFHQHTIAIQHFAPTLTLDGLRVIQTLNAK